MAALQNVQGRFMRFIVTNHSKMVLVLSSLQWILKTVLFVLLFSFLCNTAFAASGNLFKVTSSGGDAVNITLCLNINGKFPISCQNYNTQAGTLSINTTIPNHTYNYAGIRVNTPGFKVVTSRLRVTGSGFTWIGTVSQTTAAVVTLVAASLTSQNITFTSAAPTDATVGGAPYNVTATGGASGNPVIFTIDGTSTSVCTISGSTVSFIGAGTCIIDANQEGNSNYSAAPQVQQSFAVAQASQNITFTSAVPIDATVDGTPYNVTATGGASGNPVIFTIDDISTSICTISGSTVSFIGAGTCIIDANQAGNTAYSVATEVQQLVTVHSETPTTTVVYPSSNPKVKSSTITFSANVGSDNGIPSAGTVGFTLSGSPISNCTSQSLSSGIATCTTTLPSTPVPSTFSVVATYTGGSGFVASTSVPLSQGIVNNSAVLTKISTVPAAPQFVSSLAGDGSVTIKWFPPANTGGSGITSYTVMYGATSSALYSTPGCTTSNLNCVVSSLTNGVSYTFTVAATNSTGSGLLAFSDSVAPGMVLTASPSNLALSGLGNGASRSTTIANNSVSEIVIASVSTPSPDLPLDSTVDTSQINACTSGITLAANGGFCTITIAPGSVPTSTTTCTAGTIPSPSVITVMDNHGNTTTANIVILGYGCQYQNGYLFSIDDTTPLTNSIGGRVLALIDQSTDVIRWGLIQNVGGINDASTIASPSPAPTGSASVPMGQLNCNAINDGACATNNIYLAYGTPYPGYAAELCKSTIDGYTDWYLPSVCDFGPFGSSGVTGDYPHNTSSQTCTTGSTNIQNQLVSTGIVTIFSTDPYWCSTSSSQTALYAWTQLLNVSGGTQTYIVHTAPSVAMVRCSRALTL